MNAASRVARRHPSVILHAPLCDHPKLCSWRAVSTRDDARSARCTRQIPSRHHHSPGTRSFVLVPLDCISSGSPGSSNGVITVAELESMLGGLRESLASIQESRAQVREQLGPFVSPAGPFVSPAGPFVSPVGLVASWWPVRLPQGRSFRFVRSLDTCACGPALLCGVQCCTALGCKLQQHANPSGNSASLSMCLCCGL